MDWVHCNVCYFQPRPGEAQRSFFLTNCGHILCGECVAKIQDGICEVCRQKCNVLKLSAQMNPDLAYYFTDAGELAKKIVQAIEFQKMHRERLIARRRLREHYRKLKGRYEQQYTKCSRMKAYIAELQKRVPLLKQHLAAIQAGTRGPASVARTNMPPSGNIAPTPNVGVPLGGNLAPPSQQVGRLNPAPSGGLATPSYSRNLAPPSQRLIPASSGGLTTPSYSRNLAPPSQRLIPASSGGLTTPSYSRNLAPPSQQVGRLNPAPSGSLATPSYSRNLAPPSQRLIPASSGGRTTPSYSRNLAPPSQQVGRLNPVPSGGLATPSYSRNLAPPSQRLIPASLGGRTTPSYSRNLAPPSQQVGRLNPVPSGGLATPSYSCVSGNTPLSATPTSVVQRGTAPPSILRGGLPVTSRVATSSSTPLQNRQPFSQRASFSTSIARPTPGSGIARLRTMPPPPPMPPMPSVLRQQRLGPAGVNVDAVSQLHLRTTFATEPATLKYPFSQRPGASLAAAVRPNAGV